MHIFLASTTIDQIVPFSISIRTVHSASSETQGQIKGARESFSLRHFFPTEKIQKNRNSRCTYQSQSVLICKEMFLHLYGISYSRLRRLKEHYETHGIYPRTHGNTKRLPSNTLPQSTTENVHNYFKIVSNFTCLTACEITYNNFEISLVVFMPNITTNHAITYTNNV